MRQITRFMMIAASLATPHSPLWAQAAYPSQPIRFIVPYSPGGLPDVVIRQVGIRLGDKLGQSVLVDNRTGAGGISAAQAVLSSPADGYAFLFSDAAMISIAPLMMKNMPYDPQKDLLPVSYTARAPNYVAVHPSVPAATIQEFIALARSKPGTLSCGSSGVGSLHHLTLEWMKKSLDIDVVHVPFKGSGQSVPALLGGQVNCLLASLAPISGAMSAGKIRVLAFAGVRRTSLAPEIPAIGEAMKGFDSAFVLGVLARTNLPMALANRLSGEIAAIVKEPDVVANLKKIGVEAVGQGPREYAEALRIDAEQMANVVRLAAITLE
ncbi:MAG: Bug family tripartite tricarboxylate transporter substrate binding protein [Burkholderiales bacterium]